MQEVDDEDDHYWTEACEGIAKRMLKYLEDSGVTKVSTRELKEQVLSPSESSANIVRIARQTRNGKKQEAISDFQTMSERGPHRQYVKMGRTDENPGGAGEALLDSERQEVLVVLMDGKINMRKTAPEKSQRVDLRGVEGAGGAVS